jgi:hypothetical protein
MTLACMDCSRQILGELEELVDGTNVDLFDARMTISINKVELMKFLRIMIS